MEFILNGIRQAFQLLFSFNSDLYQIVGLSLYVSLMSTLIATVLALPLGLMMATHEFIFKRLLSKILYTLMGMPPVVLGLIVYLVLARSGPLGTLNLIFTPTAMIIAQVLLITPIVTSLVMNNTAVIAKEIINTCKTLGAGQWMTLSRLLFESRPFIFIAVIAGFSRAVSEVGAVMVVGGNIQGFTRVMTTFIALNNSQGKYAQSIAMGIILMVIAFVINSVSYHFAMGGSRGNNH